METANRNWINEQMASALDAVDTIKAAKRQRVQDYDERLRRLQDFVRDMQFTRRDEKQLELFDRAKALSPEIQELITAPLCGLE